MPRVAGGFDGPMNPLATRRGRSAFLILFLLGLAAVVLSLPFPPPILAVVGGGAGLALFVGLGLALGRAHGLGAPLLERWGEGALFRRWIAASLTFGPATGAVLGALTLWWFRQPYVPGTAVVRARLEAEQLTAPWKRWIVSFDAAVLEEIGFRLFVVSAIAWLLARRWSPARSWAPATRVGAAIAASAVGFGAAHLPKWLPTAAGDPSLGMSLLAINAFGGIVFGVVFRRWGIEAAILSHFTADAVLRLLGPLVVGV